MFLLFFIRFEVSADTFALPSKQDHVKWRGRWRSIFTRTVQFPEEPEIEFDIVSANYGDYSVLVFIWDTSTKTATLIREYHPGPHEWKWGVVAGAYEPNKHSSAMDAAKCEVEEEARLVGGKWIPLLQTPDLSVPHDKYGTNRFFPWLVLDCSVVKDEAAARPRDAEETIVVMRGISEKRLRDLLNNAMLNVPSSYSALLALARLKDMDLL